MLMTLIAAHRESAQNLGGQIFIYISRKDEAKMYRSS